MEQAYCEDPNHIGKPDEEHGSGIWLFTVEDALWICPRCSSRRFLEKIRKIKEEDKDGKM